MLVRDALVRVVDPDMHAEHIIAMLDAAAGGHWFEPSTAHYFSRSAHTRTDAKPPQTGLMCWGVLGRAGGECDAGCDASPELASHPHQIGAVHRAPRLSLSRGASGRARPQPYANPGHRSRGRKGPHTLAA